MGCSVQPTSRSALMGFLEIFCRDDNWFCDYRLYSVEMTIVTIYENVRRPGDSWVNDCEDELLMAKYWVSLWFSQRTEPRERKTGSWGCIVKLSECGSTDEIATEEFDGFWPCYQQNDEEISDVMGHAKVPADSRLVQLMDICEIPWCLAHNSLL
jgi:hypothetical protein